MAAANLLQLQREQLIAIARGDVDAAHQVERLLAISNLSGFGQSQVGDDVNLDATGTLLSVLLPVGRYFIDLVVMADVDTGSGADGFSVINATTATLSAGAYLFLAGDSTPTVLTASAPNDSASFLFSGAASTQLSLRGFVDVQKAGLLGFRVVLTGAPTSATLLAGSGLTTTLQRGVV